MTPAAVLICTTLVTTVPHGSIAQQNCRFVEPPFIGSKSLAAETPARKDTNASTALPMTRYASVESVAPVTPVPPVVSAPPVAPVAAVAPVAQVTKSVSTSPVAKPISKPVVKFAKRYRVKARGKVAHLTTFRRYGKFVVSPTAGEAPQNQTPLSFWEKLKQFDLLK